MRDFLQERTLRLAIPWAIIFTLGSLPRIQQGPFPDTFWFMASFAFFVLTLAMGACIAWGDKGGMRGFWPPGFWRARPVAITAAIGVLVALILALFDLPLQRALQEAGLEDLEELSYPRNWSAWIALLLWNISFTSIFFTCAGMAVFSRVIRSWKIALVVVAVLRLCGSYYRLEAYDLMHLWPVATVTTLTYALSSGWLFARYGFPAVAMLAIFSAFRHLLGPFFGTE